MTRINLIPVEELSDQHLLAEYRELPRVIKQEVKIDNIPTKYVLGRGHVKWAKYYSVFTLRRYLEITWEMTYRGFKVNYPYHKLYEYYLANSYNEKYTNWYYTTGEDVRLSRNRIIEKLKQKPDWYRWTNRDKPDYI